MRNTEGNRVWYKIRVFLLEVSDYVVGFPDLLLLRVEAPRDVVPLRKVARDLSLDVVDARAEVPDLRLTQAPGLPHTESPPSPGVPLFR